MPKAPKAPPTPTAKQRQVLKTLADPRGEGRVYIVFHAPVHAWASGSAYLELSPSGLTETILPSTFEALRRQEWLEEIREWSQTGVTYWRISAAGRESLL